ncbi:MAG: hypothetical protein JJU29_21460 [Verrucomicrobia bacterium]|nr:hypothetical protein [Verrucomicrobiota bacterium]MCH8514332.1 hypothetical protein [Kiritimatiellia bacterium]
MHIFRTFLLFVLLLVHPLFAQTLYWGGGSGNWTGTANWHENADLSDPAQLWTDGRNAVVASGTVTVNNHVIVHHLEIPDGAEVRIGSGNQDLQIQGTTSGEGILRFTRTSGGNTSGVTFAGSQAQTVSWELLLNNQQSRVRVTAAGTGMLTLDGKMDAFGDDFDIELASGSHLLIGPNARINNNRPDLVNARPFRVFAEDASAIFEMHADFNADLADPSVFENTYPYAKSEDDPGDGYYVKPVGGLSTWRTDSATVITRNSQNLATIHKYTGAPTRYTHHGLWNFEGPGAETSNWIVRENPQSYDGGIYFTKDWRLTTEEDFTFEGYWHNGVNIGFSTRGHSNVTFYKSGPADFIITGTQAYGTGTTMQVEEGGVRFYTDPNINSFPEAKSANSWFDNTGNYLHLIVLPGAEASFFPPEGVTFSIAHADITGTLHLDWFGAQPLSVAGDATLQGTLVVTSQVDLTASEYLLLTANGTLNYDPASVEAPSGWQVEQEGDELWLRPGSATGYAEWVSHFPPEITDRNPLDDPWNHGITNLARYAHGIEPGALPTATDLPMIVRDPENGSIWLRFQRPATAPSDLAYELQITEDLTVDPAEGWTTIDNPDWVVEPNGEMEIVHVSLSDLPNQSRLFARVRIRLL